MPVRYLLANYLRSRFQHWNREQLEAHQQRRLRKILAYAGRYSPYYRELFQGTPPLELSAWPEMDKPTLMAHYNAINTRGLDRDALTAFRIAAERDGALRLFPGGYAVGLSSGTSGNKTLSVLSRWERWRYAALLYARCGLAGDGIGGQRVLFALRTNNPSFMAIRSLGVHLRYVDYTHPADELVERINEERLSILAGPPSLLALLAARVERIQPRIRALISYAEVLTPELRLTLEQAFGVPVTELYQGAEGFLAGPCRCGRLHLNEDAVLLELEPVTDGLDGTVKRGCEQSEPSFLAQRQAKGEATSAFMLSRVVVTDLYRTTQPMIRYALNDLLEMDPEPCPCGSCFRVIRRIHGRQDDVFILCDTKGEKRLLFPDYVRRAVNQASDAILEYQVLLHSRERIEIRLVLDPAAAETAVQQSVRRNFQRRLAALGCEQNVNVFFSSTPPERNPRSRKLIRVQRLFKDPLS